MTFTTIFFDLDDTLYPSSSGLWPEISNRINQYIQNYLNLSWDEVIEIRKGFIAKYETTLRGLKAGYDINEKDYLQYVHDIPLSDYLRPDPIIQQMLKELPHRKIIFTNADADHAGRVIEVLGISKYFDGIVDILSMAPYCKPQPEAYEFALIEAGERIPGRCVMIDDRIDNLDAAQLMGIATVQVGSTDLASERHTTISDLAKLLDVMPGLFVGLRKSP